MNWYTALNESNHSFLPTINNLKMKYFGNNDFFLSEFPMIFFIFFVPLHVCIWIALRHILYLRINIYQGIYLCLLPSWLRFLIIKRSKILLCSYMDLNVPLLYLKKVALIFIGVEFFEWSNQIFILL